jgi:hypothetical protein
MLGQKKVHPSLTFAGQKGATLGTISRLLTGRNDTQRNESQLKNVQHNDYKYHDTLHKDIKYHDTLHNDIKYNGIHDKNKSNVTLSIMTLSICNGIALLC